MYNFDEVISRRNTNSMKYDFNQQYNKPEDAIPLWVADMDFRTPPEVMAAIQKVADHGIYGYTETKEDYFRALFDWFGSRYNCNIKEEWLIKCPGVVFALGMAIKALTAPGDAIIIQKPLYYPIENTIIANARIPIDSTLVYTNGHYTIDFSDFERKIVENNVRMFVLCNPHNPGGRVWTNNELMTLGRICKKHNVIVVSDEIHCDIVFEGHKHIVFSTVCEGFADFTVTLTAPSKTFNLAGLQVSNMFVENEEMRNKISHEIHSTGYSQLNTMGLAACQAAYESGGAWLCALMQYLTKNAEFVREYLGKHVPKINAIMPQGSYLMWVDMNALGMPHAELEARMDKLGVWPSSGTAFGATGEGFFRINLACPRSVLEAGMERIVAAVG